MKHAGTVPVLMYHHVSPSAGAITCSPANFEDQLKWLSQWNYRSLTCSEFAGHLNGQGVPERSVLITFDDGYLDNWVYAYPLLKQYGFNAVIFLVTAWINDGPIRAQYDADVVPATPEHSECERLIDSGQSDRAVLRWSEIQHMQTDGTVEFHSHTHTHTRWDKSDRAHEKNALMQQELALSRAALKKNLGSVSDHFCWPQGYFDDDYIRIAQDAGFRYLYTTKAFGQNKKDTDPAHIYRFAVRNTTGVSVGRRIRVAANPVIAPVFNRWKIWKRSLRDA